MIKHITPFRGIIVSGQKKIAMVDLISLYEELDFTYVMVYIQSRTVVSMHKIRRPKIFHLLLLT